MTERRYWLTVREIATLVHRSPTTIYNWIDAGHLTTRVSEQGTVTVDAFSAINAEADIKRGWPKGKTRRAE